MWNKSILTTATKNLAVPLSRLCRSVMGTTQSGYTRFRWWNGTCRAATKLKPYTQCRSKAKSGAPGPNKSRAAIEGSHAANKKDEEDIREGRNAIRDKEGFAHHHSRRWPRRPRFAAGSKRRSTWGRAAKRPRPPSPLLPHQASSLFHRSSLSQGHSTAQSLPLARALLYLYILGRGG